MTIIKFHGFSETGGAVGVGSSAVLGGWRNLREQSSHKRTMQTSMSGATAAITLNAFEPSGKKPIMSIKPTTKTHQRYIFVNRIARLFPTNIATPSGKARPTTTAPAMRVNHIKF